MSELTRYLEMLGGRAADGELLELRYRVVDHVLAAEFWTARDVSGIAGAILGRSRHTDIYVGYAPRLRASGTKRDIGDVWVLWAECDGATAAAAALAHRPAPPVVIRSGSGPNLHAYWPLRAPISAKVAEQANLRLARALRADAACFDATRILRPPATWNHKRLPPARVAAIGLRPEVRFDLGDVLARTPAVEDALVARRWRERPARDGSRDPLLGIAPAVYVSRLLGVAARPGRKVHCPFHPDERPSLHVYPSAARGWWCFSCGRGGSVYDLGAHLWRLETRGAEFLALRSRLLEALGSELVVPASRGLSR
jgi:hypothetical protein